MLSVLFQTCLDVVSIDFEYVIKSFELILDATLKLSGQFPVIKVHRRIQEQALKFSFCAVLYGQVQALEALKRVLKAVEPHCDAEIFPDLNLGQVEVDIELS